MNCLKTFFAEKNLPEVAWELFDTEGVTHWIGSDVVIEAIHGTQGAERKAIEGMIRKLDFHNADINDYLRHLAQGLVNG